MWYPVICGLQKATHFTLTSAWAGQAASEGIKCAVEPTGRLTHVLAEKFISKYVRIMNAHSEGVRSACDGVKVLGL